GSDLARRCVLHLGGHEGIRDRHQGWGGIQQSSLQSDASDGCVRLAGLAQPDRREGSHPGSCGSGQRVRDVGPPDRAGHERRWGRTAAMSLAQSMESLKKVDCNELDFNNIGSWPGALKVIVAALLFAVLLFLGYQFHLKDLQAQLERTEAQEATLRKEFSDKSFKAANLDAYKEQLIEIEDRFGTLLKQLPSDTEVPGLLEDITQMGLNSGLEFESITLQPEVERQFYIELPIKIVV